jgi:hypothetical protein
MKLLQIYDNLLLNELTSLRGVTPYPYDIKDSESGWIVTFNARTSSPYAPTKLSLKYTVNVSYNATSNPLIFNNTRYYTQGYKSISVTFQADIGTYYTLTNQFDPKVLITIGTAIKDIVVRNDIQIISFSGVTKLPGRHTDVEDDGTNARTRVYKYVALLIKPDNYDIKVTGTDIRIYQKPEYYDQKRHIGQFATTTNTNTTTNTSSQAANTPAAVRRRRITVTQQTGQQQTYQAPTFTPGSGRRTAPRWDDNGNLISSQSVNSGNTGTTIDNTAPPEARRPRTVATQQQMSGDASQQIYAKRRPTFTYEIYKSQKSQSTLPNDGLQLIYKFRDESGFNNNITIQSKPMTQFPELESVARNFGSELGIQRWNPTSTIAKVTITARTSSLDNTYIYRFLRTLLTKIGEYIRLVRRTDKAIVLILPQTNIEYATTLMKDPNFIKLKQWYISKRKYREYHVGNTFIFFNTLDN